MTRRFPRPIGAAALVLSLSLAAVPAMAQESPFEGVNRRFNDVAPKIGESLPALSVYDLEGRAVQIRELVRGHYTVLVLGCLT